MADPAQALATQLANIEKKTGKSLAELSAAIKKCGKDKHGEIRAWVAVRLQLGHPPEVIVFHMVRVGATSPSLSPPPLHIVVVAHDFIFGIRNGNQLFG